MRLSLRTKLIGSVLHLALVALGAAQFRFSEWGLPGALVDMYGTLSGAGSGYGFFAPGVGTGLRVEFDVKTKEGKVITDKLETGPNRESVLRIGNILGLITRNVQDEKMRRSLTASWAGKMFARHPEAKEIVVRAETLDPPSMEGYTKGERAPWVSMYRAKFVRKGE